MKQKQKLGEYIPCLYLPHVSGSSKILIYFHGNAEDIGLATELLTFLKDMMKVSHTRETNVRCRSTFWRWNTQATACILGTRLRSRSLWMRRICTIT